MITKINTRLFNVKVFDSGSLGPLDMVFHHFTSPGSYQVIIKHNGKNILNFGLSVEERSEVMQLDIDLAQMIRKADMRSEKICVKSRPKSVYTMSSQGYITFFASSGKDYSALVVTDEGKMVFDNIKLQNNDIYALSLLEPGTYSVKNVNGNASGKITVSLKKDKFGKLGELDSQYIDVNEKQFSPDNVEVTSTQGIVFRIKGSSRIVIAKEGVIVKPEPAP